MELISLRFLFGILLLSLCSTLPSIQWLWAGLVTLLLRKKMVLMMPIILGFCWALLSAHHRLDWQLDHEIECKRIQLRGIIASLPVENTYGTQFNFWVKSLDDGVKMIPLNHLVKLTWQTQGRIQLNAGDEWLLTSKIKRIHSTLNPGGFDYEAWAFQENIRAKGTVISKDDNHLIASHWYRYPLQRIRQFIQVLIEQHLKKSTTSPWIEALIVGERHSISSEQWEVLRNTGTNHLMAIAGLHIGFMVAFTHGVVSFFWRRLGEWPLHIPAQTAAAVASLIIALMYSALAGFSIPTQRACFMLSIFMTAQILRRHYLGWHVWGLALIFTLMINPFDGLTESFWLSFGSVALIIYGMSGRLSMNNLWWKWFRVQWVIAIGLIPLSVWLFHQVSTVGLLANSIAIPWVGFLILPFCFLGTITLFFSASLGSGFLAIADFMMGTLWHMLSYFSHLSFASWYGFMPNGFILCASCIGVLLLLLPAGFPGRWLGIIGLASLLCYQPPKPNRGDVWLTLLDVGQGLSTVIQTRNHFLIFDAGPKLSANVDMGENVVAPYLSTLKAKRIDRLVISHGDNDHIGGANAILQHFPVSSINTSVPEMFKPIPATYCLRGEKWQWDQVNFEFLYPTEDKINLNNESSCVLKIKTGTQQILLTGDIEKKSERELVAHDRDSLASVILVAPHHGSKTSAENQFVEAVHPSYVLYAVGYRNRYHFPNQSVVEKYQMIGSKQLNSVDSGAIQLHVSKNGIHDLSQYRKTHQHYWNEKR